MIVKIEIEEFLNKLGKLSQVHKEGFVPLYGVVLFDIISEGKIEVTFATPFYVAKKIVLVEIIDITGNNASFGLHINVLKRLLKVVKGQKEILIEYSSDKDNNRINIKVGKGSFTVMAEDIEGSDSTHSIKINPEKYFELVPEQMSKLFQNVRYATGTNYLDINKYSINLYKQSDEKAVYSRAFDSMILATSKVEAPSSVLEGEFNLLVPIESVDLQRYVHKNRDFD